jgi:transposase
MLRAIDRFVILDGLRRHLAPFYSATGRPSVDPELTISMLLVGYCFGMARSRHHPVTSSAREQRGWDGDAVRLLQATLVQPPKLN